MIGKIKLGSETLATLEGHWDQEVYMRDKATGVSLPTQAGHRPFAKELVLFCYVLTVA